MARSTLTEISEEIETTKACIDQLEQKKEKLTNLDAEKIDEDEVEMIEK